MVATEPGPSSSELPSWVTQVLEKAGIDPNADVLTIRERLASLGLEVLELGEDWSGVPHGAPRYLAAVTDPRDPESPVGLHWSNSGYREALVRATAEVLRDQDD